MYSSICVLIGVNLTKEFEFFSSNGKKKFLSIDWDPVIDEKDGEVEKILVSVRDITEVKKLESEAIAREKQLENIQRILEIPSETFASFLRNSSHMVEDCKRLLMANPNFNTEVIKLLFINMHTIKGAARSYGLKKLASTVHQEEALYAALQKGEKDWNLKNAYDGVIRVEREFVDLYQCFYGKLHQSSLIDQSIYMKSTSQKTLGLLSQLSEKNDFDGHSKHLLEEIKAIQYDLSMAKAENVVADCCQVLPTLAKDLGKANPKWTVAAEGIYLNDAGKTVLENTLTHFLRNSMDHGLETPQQRRVAQKPEEGTLSLNFTVDADDLVIDYKDDGRGLDLKRIQQKAIETGIVTQTQQLSTEETVNLIYHPGFSTSEKVNQISGRGVGMSAVREYVEGVGGKIEIKVLANHGGQIDFKFSIRLPTKLFAVAKASP